MPLENSANYSATVLKICIVTFSILYNFFIGIMVFMSILWKLIGIKIMALSWYLYHMVTLCYLICVWDLIISIAVTNPSGVRNMFWVTIQYKCYELYIFHYISLTLSSSSPAFLCSVSFSLYFTISLFGTVVKKTRY